MVVGTEYIVGGPYPEIDVGKGEVEDEVLDVEITRLRLEDLVAESSLELVVA